MMFYMPMELHFFNYQVLAYITPSVPICLLKKFSQFGLAVQPAIELTLDPILGFFLGLFNDQVKKELSSQLQGIIKIGNKSMNSAQFSLKSHPQWVTLYIYEQRALDRRCTEKIYCTLLSKQRFGFRIKARIEKSQLCTFYMDYFSTLYIKHHFLELETYFKLIAERVDLVYIFMIYNLQETSFDDYFYRKKHLKIRQSM